MRPVPESFQILYMLGVVCFVIALVYMLVGMTSVYNRKKSSAFGVSALFSSFAVIAGFSVIFHMFATIIGITPAIAFIGSMVFPIYAVSVIVRINLKAGAVMMLITSFCFLGVAGDYSTELNTIASVKKYTTSAYYNFIRSVKE